jgi:amino acid adenylation domain-containing protein
MTPILNKHTQDSVLSKQQQRLWERQQTDQTIGVSWCRVELRGIAPEQLFAALRKAVQRHSILRTVFATSPAEGPIFQKILDASNIDWEQLDWRQFDESAQKIHLAKAYEECRKAALDLNHGPVVHARFIYLAEEVSELLLMMPSLCSDADSLQECAKEVSQELTGIHCNGVMPMQYAEYVEWQQNIMSEEDATRGEAYWRRILGRSGISEEKLSFESRGEGQGHSRRMKVAAISDEALRELNEFCGRIGSRLEAVLLASWQVLLWKVNNREKVGFYRWCHGMPQIISREVRGLLGRYVPVPNRLVLGIRVEEIVEELEQYIADAEEWQEFWPGGEAEHRLQFEYHDEIPAWTAGQARFAITEIAADIEKYHLKLCCIAGKQSLRTELRYDPEFFEGQTIERLLQQWQQLLLSVVRGNEKIEDLAISSASERQQILTGFNNTSCDFPRTCLHELIQEQVERTPDAPAVIFQNDEISYQELNRRANQLAHYLLEEGIGPEVLVGIHLDRSIEMVVALLAVLKAGGAYVPLDPQYPRERLLYMLESSHAPVIITTRKLADKHKDAAEPASGAPAHWLCLDQEHDRIAAQSPVNPKTISHPENLAYVIYTSGSTGKPKGAMNTHAGIVNRLHWMQKTFGLNATDRVLQKTPFSFDVSVWEFFWPLLAGATVVMAIPGGHQDAGYMADVIRHKHITTLHFVPSMLQVFLEETDTSRCTSLRRVIASGEALPWVLQQSFFERLPAELHNLYGPTEAAVDVTWWPCNSNRNKGVVPIGRPVDNTQLYILDENYLPAPIGVSGELYIGGVQVGRGYFNRPDLTAERFIPNLYSYLPGDRLYRTGDRARWMDDGQVEFLGRLDDQVKIRGFRIELGEIEAVLRLSPDVRDAAVVKKSRAAGDCLVAYVVPHHQGALAAKTLQSFVAEKLPGYMVPEIIVALEHMPYTPSGKLDRRALPDPKQSPEPDEDKFIAPRTPVEALIAGIWAEVLGLERVSAEGNFFDLGGQSILAGRIIIRLRSVLNVNITPQALFEAGTVARLAALVEDKTWQVNHVEELALAPAPRNARLPLTAAQERLWFFDQLSPGNLAYALVQAVRITGPLNLQGLQYSLTELVRRHESLRTTFPAFRGEPYQQVHAPRPIKLELTDLSLREDREQEVGRGIEREELTPFNLARGPLFRVKIWKLAPQSHVVAFAVHHIVFDAWSLGVMVREVSLLYEGFCKGTTVSLPELPVQYVDFAYWEKQNLKGEKLENHMAFWRKHLKEPLPHFSLKSDYARPAIQTFRGAKLDIEMSSELVDAMKQLGKRQGATLFMVLLTAFDFLMYYYSTATDIIIGTDIANRDKAETENLIGLFANQIPIRCDLSGNPSFLQLLAQVRRSTLSAYAHQQVPLDRIITELRLQRSAAGTPLFQVKMELVNTPFVPLQMFELDTEPIGFNHAFAKLDLVLLLHEQPTGLRGWYEYNSDLFAPETIAQMAARFELLLRRIVQNPQITLSESVEEINNWNLNLQQSPAAEQSDDYQWWFSWIFQSAQRLSR